MFQTRPRNFILAVSNEIYEIYFLSTGNLPFHSALFPSINYAGKYSVDGCSSTAIERGRKKEGGGFEFGLRMRRGTKLTRRRRQSI